MPHIDDFVYWPIWTTSFEKPKIFTIDRIEMLVFSPLLIDRAFHRIL